MNQNLETIIVLPHDADPSATGLVSIPQASIQTFFTEPEVSDPILAAIEREVRSFIPDTSTAKGRDAIKSLAYKVTRTKTGLDGLGKTLVEGLKDLPKRIDASRKVLRDRLDVLAEEVRQPLTLWEAEQERTAEAKRKREEGIRARVSWLSGRASELVAASSSQVSEEAGRIEAMEITEDEFAPYVVEATSAKAACLAALVDLHAIRLRHETEQAELQRLREAEAERKAEEERERLRKEGEERAKREAEEANQREREAAARREQEAKDAAEKAEREKEEAEQRAKEAEAREAQAKKDAEAQAEAARVQAIEDERKRVEAERLRQEAEEKARAANRDHRAGVNREIVADLVGLAQGITEDQAKEIVRAIVEKRIRHTAISY